MKSFAASVAESWKSVGQKTIFIVLFLEGHDGREKTGHIGENMRRELICVGREDGS